MPHTLKNIKKAAMFGLDARISLAIFGTLSIVAGVELLSAINKTRMNVLHQTFLEIEKSIEAYVLDTSSHLPKTTAVITAPWMDNLADVNELFTSTAPGWKGPYLPTKGVEPDPTRYNIKWPGSYTRDSFLYLYKHCNANKCYYSAAFSHVNNTLAKAFDTFIDGAVGNDGRVSIYSDTELIYKTDIVYKNPN